MQMKVLHDHEHPYKKLKPYCFWNYINLQNVFDAVTWFKPKFLLKNEKIACAGSCFAQHIGKYLRNSHSCKYLDYEPAPQFLPESLHKDYGFNLFSARFGNIYTAEALVQLYERAMRIFVTDEKCWEKGNGYVDAFRPTIERIPFSSKEELLTQRQRHLQKVEKLFKDCTIFIFTLGLTEAWRDRKDGTVYPIVPGSNKGGGKFDADKYEFVNFSFNDVYSAIEKFYGYMSKGKDNFKMILTVSPVPLAATATGENVICATSYSKSVLRAVAGEISKVYQNIDYFPSYEMITTHLTHGSAFMPDGRHIAPFAVNLVMQYFLSSYGLVQDKIEISQPEDENSCDGNDYCDDDILETFLKMGNQNV